MAQQNSAPLWVASGLVTAGSLLSAMPTAKQNLQLFLRNGHEDFDHNADDYLQFAPIAQLYAYQALPAKPRNGMLAMSANLHGG